MYLKLTRCGVRIGYVCDICQLKEISLEVLEKLLFYCGR